MTVWFTMFGLPVLMSHNQWITCEKKASIWMLVSTRESKSLFHIMEGSFDEIYKRRHSRGEIPLVLKYKDDLFGS